MICKEFTFKIEEEYDNDPGEYGGSKPSRKCTDVPGIILLILMVITAISIFGFYIKNADLDILLNGYDNNGNICGKNNIKTISTSSIEKFGINMEQHKFLFAAVYLIDNQFKLHRECVKDCSDIIVAGMKTRVYFQNRCYIEGQLISNLFLEILIFWKYVIAMLFLTILMSIIILLLYIYYTSFIVKFSVLYLGIALIGSAIYCWTNRISINKFDAYIPSDYYCEELFLVISASIFIITLLLMRFSNHMKYKLKLSILIFQEAGKSIAAMPLLLLLPFINSFSVILTVFLISYNFCLNSSYCYFEEKYYNELLRIVTADYLPVTIVPLIVVIFCLWWFIEILNSAQYMIVSGCVAQWFYTRNKHHLYKPIKTNILKVLRYHIGTISTGSVLLTIVQLLQQALGILKSSENRNESVFSCFCNFMGDTWVNATTVYLNFFTRNGYIMTAMYGYPFCKASVRAIKLLCHNLYNVILINTMGDFILLSTKLATILTSGLLFGILCYSEIFAVFKVAFILTTGAFSFYIVNEFMSVFEAAIDTIFLCFCEDCKYNNGASKPYYMSTKLAEYVENANKFVHPIKWKITAEEWEKGPKRQLEV